MNVTRIYGILAHPVGHSLSPAMFNAAFAEMGINAKYEVFENLARGRKIFRLENSSPGYISGLSISLPYKESVIEFLDEVSEDVRAIGACNTVKIQNDDGDVKKIAIGFNTDWIGFMEALKEKIASVKNLNVIVLGAGGAARAIVYGLIKEGAKVVVLNRTVEKAAKIVKDFSKLCKGCETVPIQFGRLDEIENFKCDVLVQATSAGVGTEGIEESFVSEEFLQKNEPVVFDIIYKPLITPLLQMAIDNGCDIITGEKMLLNQAVKQFEIWFGEKAPKDVMNKELNKFIV